MDTETTYDVLTNWYSAMGAGDTDGIMNALADDVVFVLAPKPYTRVIPYLGTWVGHEGFAEASKIRSETTRITGYALRDLVAQGSKAMALIYSKAICVATGKEFELEVVHRLELNDDGKIATCTAYFDPVPEINAFTPDASGGAE